MARILAIGTATLDLIFTWHYPDEVPLRAYFMGLGLAEVLSLACQLAGKKCGQVGLEGLGETSLLSPANPADRRCS